MQQLVSYHTQSPPQLPPFVLPPLLMILFLYLGLSGFHSR
ncbi:hypothetical protein LINPERPRIM_LOCUS43971 [Linum perenne]